MSDGASLFFNIGQNLICPIQFSFSSFSWIFVIVYSTAKFKYSVEEHLCLSEHFE
jgi:hypothetical protein